MVTEIHRGGNFFAEPHAFNVSFATGILKNRYGRRYVALTETFLSGFLEGIEIECGEATDEVLYTCGWEYGDIHARHLDEDLSRYYGSNSRQFAMAKFTALVHEALSHDGWGHLEMDYSQHEHGVLAATVKNPIYSSVVKGRGACSDSLLAGFLGGVFSYFAETRLDCLQTSAPAADDLRGEPAQRPSSTFVITTRQRIDDVMGVLDAGGGHCEVIAELSRAKAA
ncbi:hypothetical protein Poly30_01050 [Planctomycetes bacterium Poly30]|uniref:V4R domain protein n=1 Tax=Saltatorellus ferox TaxID=2528018 RepID=A0A518EKJ4_9BACT|nr:hypothetical protein Poly30_01050 [Planctomycetes bacterium Poly30]